MKNPDKMSKLELRNEVLKLRNMIESSGGLKCPNCDDEGFTVDTVSSIQWDCDPRDPDGDPVPIQGYEFVQVQCEFCYTVPDSIFRRGQREKA